MEKEREIFGDEILIHHEFLEFLNRLRNDLKQSFALLNVCNAKTEYIYINCCNYNDEKKKTNHCIKSTTNEKTN